ncbi:hypothetical protein SUGI_1013370, partial [Cryptomeria japonica]
FHNLWDQSNQQVWLVMDQYDETSESANGLGLIDVPRRQSFNKLLNGEWRSADSQWILRGGDGGLLVFSCKKNGTLRVINPLTMQSHSLDDAVINRKSKISYYMKKYHDDVAVHLKFNSNEKTYQTLGIVMYKGRMILVRRTEAFGFSASTALMFYEFDDVGMQWRSKYKAVVQPHYVPRRLICAGGDYIWVMQKRAGHASHIISVDIDAGELKIWPEDLRFMFNVRKCLSMPLKFYPCP